MIAAIPKAELHCHAGLVVDPEMLRAMLRRGHALPVSPEELEAKVPVAGWNQLAAISEYLRPFRSPRWPDLYGLMVELYVRRLIEQNVVYAELGIGLLPASGPLTDGNTYRNFKQIAENAQGPNLRVGILGTVLRTVAPDDLAASFPVIRGLLDEGTICGIQWIGPYERSLEPFARTIAELQDAGMPMTLHTGEFLGPESVTEDLKYMRPDRIGHGLAIFKSPRLIARVQERGIPIEFCLTSNLRLGAVSRLDKHPLRQAFDLGLKLSINTDDPGVLGCSVQSEYQLAADAFGLTVDDLKRVTTDSLAAAFAR